MMYVMQWAMVHPYLFTICICGFTPICMGHYPWWYRSLNRKDQHK